MRFSGFKRVSWRISSRIHVGGAIAAARPWAVDRIRISNASDPSLRSFAVKKARVGNRVREQRRQAVLTRSQLAELAGATRQTIIAVAAGKYVPSRALAFRIARAFGAPFEAVWTYEDGR